jgi:hypothetical protein
MKTINHKTKKVRTYVIIDNIRYIKQGNILVLSQILKNTFDQFHNYQRLQTNN